MTWVRIGNRWVNKTAITYVEVSATETTVLLIAIGDEETRSIYASNALAVAARDAILASDTVITICPPPQGRPMTEPLVAPPPTADQLLAQYGSGVVWLKNSQPGPTALSAAPPHA